MKTKEELVNAAPMADVAFLLLIFFLVATTMDMDTGIFRKLPMFEKEPIPGTIKKRNVMAVLVNFNDEIMINTELTNPVEIRNEFSEKKFGKKFEGLSDNFQNSVLKAKPCIISEAEPKFLE